MERITWSKELSLEEKLKLLGTISEDGTEITVKAIHAANVINAMWEELIQTRIKLIHILNPNGLIDTRSIDQVIERQQCVNEMGFVFYHNIVVT